LYVAHELDGELVLVRRDGRKILLLNDSARVCWEALAPSGRADAASQALAEAFDLPLTHARADAAAFLTRLGDEADGLARGGARPSHCRTLPSAVAAAETYALCGVPLRLDFGSEALAEVFRPLLLPTRVGGDVPPAAALRITMEGRTILVADATTVIGQSRDIEEAIGLVIDAILERSYRGARWMAILHAAAIGDGDGAILLPGVNGAGKTTLALALVASGLHYLSDDMAPLDGTTGCVVPVPFAAALKPGSWPVLRRAFSQIAALPTHAGRDGARRFLNLIGHTAPGPLPPRLILVPRRGPVGRPSLRRLRPAEVLAAILAARCWVSPEPDLQARWFALLAEVPAFELSYRSVDEAVPLVRKALAGTVDALPRRDLVCA
jgi:hypothetical protein